MQNNSLPPIQKRWNIHRFTENPIISPFMLGNADENINGPSLIKTPDWLPNRLGAYYLYFSHHRGASIRLAYADSLHGPWKIHAGGVLPCDSLPWPAGHIASPDAHIDVENKRIILYFHTLDPTKPGQNAAHEGPAQCTFAATSTDGLHFSARPEPLGDFYFRVWQWKNTYYALPRLAQPLLRSCDGFFPFESTASPFADQSLFTNIRHVAVLVEGNDLLVLYSRIGDMPESIFMTTVHMTDDWTRWSVNAAQLLIRPETGYEGANLPLSPSRRGMTYGFEHALRDPFLYMENNRLYLLYCVVAERGIAIAELR